MDCVPLRAHTPAQAACEDGHWLWYSRLGHGGNEATWYVGDKVLVSVLPCGAVTGWLVGSANLNDRWLMNGLLSARAGQRELRLPPPNHRVARSQRPTLPDGEVRGWTAVGTFSTLPYLADRNFKGETWQAQWKTCYGATVLTKPARHDQTQWDKRTRRWFSGLRQIIDTTFARLDATFAFKRLEAHAYWGQVTRIAATFAAYNLGLYLNRLLGRPLGAVYTLLC